MGARKHNELLLSPGFHVALLCCSRKMLPFHLELKISSACIHYFSVHSKKDNETRQNELRSGILDPLLKCLIENIDDVIKDNSDCQVLLAALEHSDGMELFRLSWFQLDK